APLAPNFVSVTYGAGGSTRERTHSTIARILKDTNLTPAAHLTCVGAPKGEIDDVVARYHEIGVRHIVALRGDPTTGIGTAHRAVLAGGQVRRARRRRRNPQAGGRNGRGGPGAKTGKTGRRYLSFLHHEPRGPGVRDQPFAGHPPQWRTESRLIR